MKELQKILEQKRSEGKKEIDGKSAFYLYDTFGFPLELTVELAQEENLTVDEEACRCHGRAEAKGKRRTELLPEADYCSRCIRWTG